MITGAGSGIGKHLALAAEKEGALVCYTDRNPEALQALQALLQEDGHRGYLCDSADISSIDTLWAALQRDNVQVDALVNCSGSKASKIHFSDTTPEQWGTAYAANVQGPAYLTQLVTRAMTKDKRTGSILFISSVHGQITGGWPHYSASKAALNMLVKELALELGGDGIRVNAIAPGWTAEPEEPGADYFEHAPLGQRAIPPEYISRACIFLLSNYHSAYTTGTCLTVDAGVSLRSYRTPAIPPEGDPHTRWPLNSGHSQWQKDRQ
ncbi:MAG: SDR family oxidoreductase [Pseudomonadales bacterium]